METSGSASPELIYSLRRVSESAALAAFEWIGRGDGMDGGRAALDAMLGALAEVDIDAVVVIGEAGKGEAPQPTRGQRLGRKLTTPGIHGTVGGRRRHGEQRVGTRSRPRRRWSSCSPALKTKLSSHRRQMSV